MIKTLQKALGVTQDGIAGLGFTGMRNSSPPSVTVGQTFNLGKI